MQLAHHLLPLLFTIWITSPFGVAADCGWPAVPVNGRATIAGLSASQTQDVDRVHSPGTVAAYICDPGFDLIGNPSLTCGADGQWQGKLPICGTNVVLRKTANQSSTNRGGSAMNAIDGDRSIHHDDGGTGARCSETSAEMSPWWMANLMSPLVVNAVRITTRACCDFQLHDLEIRVGNSTIPQRNPLCAWFPGQVDDGETTTFQCERSKPLVGQFVSVQMVGVEGSLSLCEVEIFSGDGDVPRERCTDSADLDKVVAFQRTCYELHLNEGSSFPKARDYCMKRKGDVWHHVDGNTFDIVSGELERQKSTMKTPMVWMGAQKEPGIVSRTWKWVTGSPVDKPLWGRDQPNNYNGEQNCVALDGGRNWLWNDVGCNLDYFHWVCMFSPLSCGHPDQKVNNTVIGQNFTMGATVQYRCPTGSVVVGAETRTCQNNGMWSNKAPTCKHVNCGPLADIENGEFELTDLRTTYNSSVQYTCAENYTLVGATSRTCTAKGTWDPAEPKCLYGRCPELELFERGTITVGGLNAGDKATFVCDVGHRLIGNKVLNCQLGGQWSSRPPTCLFVDCGPLDQIENGQMRLDNSSTTFGSLATYTCQSDYIMEGQNRRICKEDSTWSAKAPVCRLINCGQPAVPSGGYIEGKDFNIHSNINYRCNDGHKMTGAVTSRCLSTGAWSSPAPSCRFIDCEDLPPISNGEINYVNGTTYLGSTATYTCNQFYRMQWPNGSDPVRSCAEDGKWSGFPPSCREIRCPIPERPHGAVLSVSSPDRLRTATLLRSSDRDSTFRIGSNLIFNCQRGYRLDGKPTKVCDSTGEWIGETPQCTFVDCGAPGSIAHGQVSLIYNGTFFGASAQYSCDENYTLEGIGKLMCLENGTWSGSAPVCRETTCAIPSNSFGVVGLLISPNRITVGGVATYSCTVGRNLVGPTTSRCLANGRWEGQKPSCSLVDCGAPKLLDNGRVFLVNASTTYGSLVEYHCIEGFQRSGLFSRQCGAEGAWEGADPLCIEEGKELPIPPSIPAFPDNGLDSLSSEREGSNGNGIWIGIGIGAALVLLVIVSVVFLKMKRGSWGKSTYPKSGSKKRSTVVLSPPNMPLPPTPHVTFASAPPGHHPPQPSVYASTGADIYEHLPGESQHTYDMTYEDTRSSRLKSSNGGSPRPPSPPPSPPAGVTVNGFVLA